jgi:exodeoxyribonuclease VII large subunit
MEPVGAGSLQLAFEQLKEKLKAEGLFDQSRKRPLPPFPRTVGIVTSPTGAVIRDFLNIVARRHSGLNVLLCPVSVQGEFSAGEVEAALACLNDSGLADVIVIARGGGSLEDLAPFNSERVARAIVASRLPVVSAIGHETDFTIADFAADLRAPTPSAAAELITGAQHNIAEHLARLNHRLERAAHFLILKARQRLSRVPASRAESRMASLLHRLEQRLDDLGFRMENSVRQEILSRQRHVAELAAAVLRHDPRRRLAHARAHFDTCRTRLDRTLERTLEAARSRLGSLDAQLNSLSPLSVLDRGYALVIDKQGAVVRSSRQVTPGDTVMTRISDGTFTSQVTGIAEKGMRNRE